MKGYVTIDMPKLSLKVARNYVWLEKLVLTTSAGVLLPLQTEKPVLEPRKKSQNPTGRGKWHRRNAAGAEESVQRAVYRQYYKMRPMLRQRATI